MGKTAKEVIKEKSDYLLSINGVIQAPLNQDVLDSKSKMNLKFLERMGLAQRVYSNSFFGKKEFPYFDSEKSKFYKLIPEPITAEEYQEILHLDNQIQLMNKGNSKPEEEVIHPDQTTEQPIQQKQTTVDKNLMVWQRIGSLADTVQFLGYGLAVVMTIASVVLGFTLESFLIMLLGILLVLIVCVTTNIFFILIKGYAQIVRNNEEQLESRR